MIHPHDSDSVDYREAMRYLRLPREYADAIGGVRWSDRVEGLALHDETELISYEELAQFLEGFGSDRPLVSFGFVLHWAFLLTAREADHPEQRRLREFFQCMRRPWRNAGAFAARLGADLTPRATAAPVEMICHRLRDRLFPITWYSGAFNGVFPKGERPPLAPEVFEKRIFTRLREYSDEELLSWFKFGRGPVQDAGERLAQEKPPGAAGLAAPRERIAGIVRHLAQPLPPASTPLLADLLARPRLAGAETYVPQMVSALSLPARLWSPQELPLGGYADIAVRGNVEQLLPSQYALEELDFLRRYAEHELLYFRREEPPAHHRQQLIVLLDQGVRTWGDVRLVLAAAAVALVRHAARKKMSPLIAFTSNRGTTLDPLSTPAEELGTPFEASDLTFNPGDALEGVLQWPSDLPRDVVLLTHPANLREEDVRAAASRIAGDDRLFALTLSPRGNAELVELRRGLPVRLKTAANRSPRTKPAAW